MTLPFSTQQFFEVMHRYNVAVWPAQLVLTMLAVASVALLWTRVPLRSVLVSAILSALWTWSGLVYHLSFFRDVNPAAGLFGALFLVAAALFAWQGIIARRLRFDALPNARTTVGLALIAYALVVYPELARALGHDYPDMPTFGLPCPLTLFTIGMLAFLVPPYPRSIFIVPVAWALVALQAAVLFGMYEDFGLAAAGVAGAWLALQRRDKAQMA